MREGCSFHFGNNHSSLINNRGWTMNKGKLPGEKGDDIFGKGWNDPINPPQYEPLDENERRLFNSELFQRYIKIVKEWAIKRIKQ